MRLFTEGFEAQTTQLWASVHANWTRRIADWNSIFPRTGVYFMGNNAATSVWETAEATVGGGVQTLYMRVPFCVNSPTTSQFRVRWGNPNNNNWGSFTLQSNGTRGVMAWGTYNKHISAFNFSADTWHVLEIMAALGGNQTLTLRLDGVQIWTRTANWGVGWPRIARVQVARYGNGTTDAWGFDDVTLQDDSGTYNNSWAGLTHLAYMAPDQDGTYRNLLRGGATQTTPHYPNVDELSPVDTDYLYALAGGSVPHVGYETFYHGTPPIPGNAIIDNVVTGFRAKTFIGGLEPTMEHAICTGGSIVTGGSIALDMTWRHHQHTFPRNRYTGAPWTQAEVKGDEYGIWTDR